MGFWNRKNDKENPYAKRKGEIREQNFTDIPGTEENDPDEGSTDPTEPIQTQAVALPAPETAGVLTGIVTAPLTPAMQAWQAPTVPLALDIDARIERYRQFSAGQQARMQVALCDYALQLEAIAKADLEENWVVDLFVDDEPILDYLAQEIATIVALRSAKEKRKRKLIAEATEDAFAEATAVYRHKYDTNVQPVAVPEDQQEAEKAKCWGNLQRKVNGLAKKAFKEAEKSTKKAKKAKKQAAEQQPTAQQPAAQPTQQPAAQTQAATQVTSASTQSAAQQSTATGSTSTTTAGTTAGTSSTGASASAGGQSA